MPSWEVVYKATADFADLVRAAQQARDELKRLQDAAKSESDAETDGALKAAAAHEADTKAIDQQRQAMEKAAMAADAYNKQVNYGGRSSMDSHLSDLDKEAQKETQLNRAQQRGFMTPQQDYAFRQQEMQQQLLWNRAQQQGYASPDQYLAYLDQQRKRMDAETASWHERSAAMSEATDAVTSHDNALQGTHQSAAGLTKTNAAAQVYSETLGDLPDDVSTKASFDDSGAEGRLAVYRAALRALPEVIRTRLEVDDDGLAAEPSRSPLPGRTDIPVPGRSQGGGPVIPGRSPPGEGLAGAQRTRQDIDGLKAGLEDLDKTKAEPEVSIRDEAKALADINAIKAAMRELAQHASLLPEGEVSHRLAVIQQAMAVGAARQMPGVAGLVPEFTALQRQLAPPVPGVPRPDTGSPDSSGLPGKQRTLDDVASVRAAIDELSGKVADPKATLDSREFFTDLGQVDAALRKLGSSSLLVQPEGLREARGAFTQLQQQASAAGLAETRRLPSPEPGPDISIKGQAKALSEIASVKAAISDLSRQIADPAVKIDSDTAVQRLQVIRQAIKNLGEGTEGLGVDPAGLDKLEASFAGVQQQAGRAFDDIKARAGESADSAGARWRSFGSAVSAVFSSMKEAGSDAADEAGNAFTRAGQRIQASFSGLSGGGAMNIFSSLSRAAAASAGSITGDFGPLLATVAALLQLLPALVAGMGAVAAIFATLPGLVVAAGGSFAALASAIKPVVSALSAYNSLLSAQQSASANPLQTSMQLAQQQQSLADAYYEVKQAAYQAQQTQLQDAHAVSDAQYEVQQASYQARMSQVSDAHAVSDAMFSLQQADFQSAQTRIQDAHNVTDAQHSLSEAIFEQAMQAEQSSMSIADAYHTLSDAQFEVTQSQYQLNMAWIQAQRDMQDLEIQVGEASLNLRGAQLNLEQAQQSYAQVMAESTSTALDRAQAAYQIQEAEEALKQVELQNTRNEQDLANARKYGVAQTYGVTQAQHALTDAQFSEIEAQKNLVITQKEAANAQIQAAYAVEDAMFSLREAVVGQANDQIVSAHNVADAQFSLWQAQQQQANDYITNAHNQSDAAFSLQQAYSQQAEGYVTSAHDQADASSALKQALDQVALGLPGIASAQEQYNSALSQLSPAAKTAVKDLEPLLYWFNNSTAAQQAFFSRLDPSLKGVGSLIKNVGSFITPVARELGTIAGEFVTWLVQMSNSPIWKVLTAGTVSIVGRLGDGVVKVADGIAHLAAAAQPFTTWFVRGLDESATRFDAWAKSADKSGSSFRRWLAEARPALHDIADLAKAVVQFFEILAGGVPQFKTTGGMQQLVGVSFSPEQNRNMQSFEMLATVLARTVLPELAVALSALARPSLANAISQLMGALTQLLATVLSSPGFQVGFDLFTRLLTSLLNTLTGIAELGPVGDILGVVAAGLGALALIKFTGILTLVENLRKVVSYAQTAWSLLGRLAGKIPGVSGWGSGGSGSEGDQAEDTPLDESATALKGAAASLEDAAASLKGSSADLDKSAGALDDSATAEDTSATETSGAGTAADVGLLGGSSLLKGILGTGGLGLLITQLLVKPLLEGLKSGPGGKNWWENPFGQSDTGKHPGWLASWAPWENELKRLTGGGISPQKGKPDGGNWLQSWTPWMHADDRLKNDISPQQGQPDGGNWMQSWAPWEKFFSDSVPHALEKAWDTGYQNFMQRIGSPVADFFGTILPNLITGTIPHWYDNAQQWWVRDVSDPVDNWITKTLPGFFTQTVPQWWSSGYQWFMRSVGSPVANWVTNSVPDFFDQTIPGWFSSVWGMFGRQVGSPVQNWITSSVPGFFTQTIPQWVKTGWATFTSQYADPVRNFILTSIPGFFDQTIPHWWDSAWGWFKAKVAAPLGEWFTSTLPSTIDNAFKNAVNWVISSVINRVIGWINDATSIVGVHIKTVQTLATGGGVRFSPMASHAGSVSGSGDEDSEPIMATPGEFMVRKAARMALDREFGPSFLPGFINQADRVLRRGQAAGYSEGGGIGSLVGGVLGDVGSGISGLLKDAWHGLSGIGDLVKQYGAKPAFDELWSHVVQPLLSSAGMSSTADEQRIVPHLVMDIADSIKQGVDNSLAGGSGTTTGGFLGGPGGGTPQANEALARSMFPWPASMWPYYVDLEMREAGFNQYARNPTSGAYGIPQALPPGKMGAAANPPESNVRAQLEWQYAYIKSVYGNPVVADNHERTVHWYARGGPVGRYFTGGDVLAAVRDATSDDHVREAMLLGSFLASKWNPSLAGDNAADAGAWQIHLPSHKGVSAEQAENPYWAAKYLLPAFSSAVAAAGPRWAANPAYAAESAAYAVDKPDEDYYASKGSAAVNAGWKAVSAALGISPQPNHPAPAPPGAVHPGKPIPGSGLNTAQKFSQAWNALLSGVTAEEKGFWPLGMRPFPGLRKSNPALWKRLVNDEALLRSRQMGALDDWRSLDASEPSAQTAAEWDKLSAGAQTLLGAFRFVPALAHAAPDTYPAALRAVTAFSGDVNAAGAAWKALYDPPTASHPGTPGPQGKAPSPAQDQNLAAQALAMVAGLGPVPAYGDGGSIADLAAMFAPHLPGLGADYSGVSSAVAGAKPVPARSLSEAGAAAAGSRSGGFHVDNINIHNPVQEKSGDSLTRSVNRLVFLAGRGPV